MLEKLYNFVFSNDDIVCVNTDLNSGSLGDDKFDDVHLETITHVRLVAWCNRYAQPKGHRKVMNKELIPVA